MPGRRSFGSQLYGDAPDLDDVYDVKKAPVTPDKVQTRSGAPQKDGALRMALRRIGRRR